MEPDGAMKPKFADRTRWLIMKGYASWWIVPPRALDHIRPFAFSTFEQARTAFATYRHK